MDGIVVPPGGTRSSGADWALSAPDARARWPASGASAFTVSMAEDAEVSIGANRVVCLSSPAVMRGCRTSVESQRRRVH
jgi:hypothetical protein